jgi:hypothetical protein
LDGLHSSTTKHSNVSRELGNRSARGTADSPCRSKSAVPWLSQQLILTITDGNPAVAQSIARGGSVRGSFHESRLADC